MVRPYSFLSSSRNTSSGARGIVIALFVVIFIGIFQWLPYGLVFLGRAIRTPFPQEDTEVVRMLQAKISDLETELEMLQRVPHKDISNNMIWASVQMGPGFVFSDSIIIAAGTDRGIQQGDIAISPEGIVLGLTDQVGAGWSKVALLSRLGNTVTLRAGNAKEIVFEARGIGGGELYVEFPSEISLYVGDPVWLGSNGEYIAGLIDAVDNAPGRQIQRITIRVPISAKRLHHAIVARTASR